MSKGTCRLYDKEFNLLAEWATDEQLYFVEDDENGRRKSGHIRKIEFIAEGPPIW